MSLRGIHLRRSALFPGGLVALVLVAGCSRPEQSGVAQSNERSKVASQPSPEKESPESEDSVSTADEAAKADGPTAQSGGPHDVEIAERETPQRRKPIRPTDNWVIFREAFDPDDDAICGTAWVGENQFEVKTENVKRVTIDLTRLPNGAPTKGPWIIRLDGQAVELTGFKPRDGYTGLKRDLVRSQNGKWSVDKSKYYRAGSK